MAIQKKAPQSLYRIRTFGDPVLKQQCNDVTTFDENLAKLAEAMFVVMHDADGVGLAAPQIGVQKRLAVWMHPDTEERHVLVNPTIVESSEETVADGEGCLSVPGYSVEVPRAQVVVVEAMDLNGETYRLELEDLLARIIQHEVDHLNGVIILDRTVPDERRRVLKAMRERTLQL